MAARRVIVRKRHPRELVIAASWSHSDRIRTVTVPYGRLLQMLLGLSGVLLFAFYLLVVQATQAVETDPKELSELTRDPQLRELAGELRLLVELAAELEQRQLWIQQTIVGKLDHAAPLEARETAAQALVATRETARQGEFFGFRYVRRRLAGATAIDLEHALGYGDFYQQHFHGLPHRAPLDKVELRVSSAYGLRRRPYVGYSGPWEFHRGLDLPARSGTPVLATARARVVMAHFSRRGYGNVVVLEHPHGYRTLYAHLRRIFVRSGQYVRAGEQIGEVGTTGNSTGPHLHYEVRRSGHALNPEELMATEAHRRRR